MEFRRRRLLNWLPLALAYAVLYMGRYNLNVAKNAMAGMIHNADFGWIFGIGTAAYAGGLFLNGPLTDRIGGRAAMLIGAIGTMSLNAAIGALWIGPAATDRRILLYGLTVLYAGNMYFQSFGAVSMVKVNSAWFHLRERGRFSGYIGSTVSLGVFFAFTVTAWILETVKDRWGIGGGRAVAAVFLAPAGCLALAAVLVALLVRDRPSDLGFPDFDLGDATVETLEPKVGGLLRAVGTDPTLLAIAAIELCTGALRQGVMQWFPIYTASVLGLAQGSLWRAGSWGDGRWALASFLVALGAVIGFQVSRGTVRRALIGLAVVAALLPFAGAGWGGLLFIAGVAGSNLAGWVSDRHFGSRRAPAAGLLYAAIALACSIGVGLFAFGDRSGMAIGGANAIGPLAFVIALGAVGCHGLLSGAATADFGGRHGAGTATGLVDAFVYIGSAIQAVGLGYITERDWRGWPAFLLPFAVLGFGLCLKIWTALPGRASR